MGHWQNVSETVAYVVDRCGCWVPIVTGLREGLWLMPC